MKTLKLLVIVAISCLLLGVSGAAMAKKGATNTNTCDLGVVPGEVVIGNLVVTSQDCVVFQAIIMGDVIVDNTRKGDAGFIFIMRDTVVNGTVEVTGGSAVISQTVVVENLTVKETVGETVVTETLIAGPGDMFFQDNQQVLIYHNVVQDGNIQCVGNFNPFTDPIGVVAIDNVAVSGQITCFGQ